MKNRHLQLLLAAFAALASACSGASEEPLPPVRLAALFDAPSPCVGAPPLPPNAAPVERGWDPQLCFPQDWDKGDVTIWLSVVDGLVQNFRVDDHGGVYHPGTPEAIEIPDSIRACILSRLKTWRYAVPLCPGHDSTSLLVARLGPGVVEGAGERGDAPDGALN